MDNQPYPQPNPVPTPGQIPPQPQNPPQAPLDPNAPIAYGTQPVVTNTIGANTIPPDAAKVLRNDRIRIVALIFTSMFSILFLILFVNMFIQWNNLNTDIESQVSAEVATREAEIKKQLEADFEEREKSPYYKLLGPEDYGSLSVSYPKTWSVYVENDGTDGNDYQAYLNPGQVNHVAADTINSLRISILNKSYDSVAQEYQSAVDSGSLNVSQRQINGQNVNVYEGELPGTGSTSRDGESTALHGAVTIFPIRDKTVVLQTDAEVFRDDFYAILDQVTYNK